MSDKPQNKSKSTDSLPDKASEKKALEPQIAKESQTDAKGQQKIELQRTNRHDGTAGKSDQGDMESVRIESIDEHGKKRVVSRKDGGSERDLLRADRKKESAEKLSDQLPPDRPAGGYDEIHNADGGITLKGVIPGPGEELENITTGTMEALASENALVKNALEMRKQIDQHMEPGPERDKIVNQLKADVTSSLMSGGLGESEIGGTHKAITDGGIETDSDKPENKEQDWQSVIEKISQLPIDKQFQIIGTGLLSFNNELEHQKLEIALGTVEGIGEGFKSIGEGVVSLANGIGQIAQFGSDVMTNNPRAIETGAQAGEAIGKTLVGGVRLFQMSHDYLYNIGFTGDYAKPFNDIANLGNELNRRWQEMPTKERTKIAAKLSTETLVGMAIPVGANKIAKAEKVTEMMEEFAAAAKTLGKESKAVDAIEETVDTLSKKGVKAIEADRRVLFDEKRPIHDRRHLQDQKELSELEILAKNSKPIEILNEGASPEFKKQLIKWVENLDPHERIFLAETDVKVVACEMVKDHFPELSEATAGIWFEKRNRIYLPEKVFSKTRNNPAPEFHLRHEFGHAFNDHSVFRENEFSRSKDFQELFLDAYKSLDKNDLMSLPYSSNEDEYISLLNKGIPVYNPDYSRHEVFADLYAHITGVGARTVYSEEVEKKFGSKCGDHIRQIVKDYMEKKLKQGLL